MDTYQRRSPVTFTSPHAETEQRQGWKVVTRYHYEGRGPFLTDLSHRARWDIQDVNLSRIQPLGVAIPDNPGECVFKNGLLISRMNRTQAAAWDIVGEDSPDIPKTFAYTDVTDAFVLLSIVGKETLSIMEKITSLDLASPLNKTPVLLQGPVLHVPCKVVVMGENNNFSGVLIAASRGYAQSIAEAILETGAEWGLRPAGEKVFSNWALGLSKAAKCPDSG
ncbi:MAG: sarcosine oxidase subunit gamma SoxG [Desulfobacterales bacterium]|nr:sarcosine oxidase subunit gamma SoxG [Desulfobacterales bacterium]